MQPVNLADLACCTRLHRRGASSPLEQVRRQLGAFLECFHPLFPEPYVAIDADDLEVVQLLAAWPGVRAVPVSPWEGYSRALNALLDEVARSPQHHRWFGCFSLETRTDEAELRAMLRHLDGDTLVVGRSLNGHAFAGGGVATPLSGATMPWNTFAVWDLSKLQRLGFLRISDGLLPESAGVEEALVISLLQRCDPAAHRAKLLGSRERPGTLDLSNWEPRRHEEHARKLASKERRAKVQLELLGIPPGEIEHHQL